MNTKCNNKKLSGAATPADKKAMIDMLDKKIEMIDYDIKIANLEYKKKIEDLKNKKSELVKERRTLLPKKKQEGSYGSYF